MTRPARRTGVMVGDLRGGVRLLVDGVRGVTGIAESMHARIAHGAEAERTTGLAKWVYQAVRGTTSLVGASLDVAMGALQAMPAEALADASRPRRDAWVSALNGVMGDHLARTANPLAIQMSLRRREADAGLPAGPDVLLLVHGLCMSDHQWRRRGHDHGQALGNALGMTPVYAHYNSGLHVSANGAELAEQLERLVQGWPVALASLSIVGHSMGGLVARSALAQAQKAGLAWPAQLRRLVFLGTPHHGAPLERAGNWLHRGLGISRHAAPLARLAELRSEGITDLRHGNLLEADWRSDHRFSPRDARTVVPLPRGVACYAVAGIWGEGLPWRSARPAAAQASAQASVEEGGNGALQSWLGDGLVPLESALGRHAQARRCLRMPASHRFVARGVHHLELLNSPLVYQRLLGWLSAA